MPIITEQSPLSAASDAVGAYSEQKRQNTDMARTAALQERAQQVREKQLGIQEKQLGLETERTASQISTEAQNRKIAAAKDEYDQTMRPLLLQAEQIDLKIKAGQVLTEEDRRALLKAQLTDQQLRTKLFAKYGDKEAALGIQQATANLAQTRAQTGLIGAETSEASARAGLYESGFGGGSLGANPLNIRTTLSQAAQQLIAQVESGQTTPAYALLYAKNNPALQPEYQKLEYVLTKRGGIKNPTQAQTKATGAEDAAARGEINLQGLQGNPKFKALPGGVQQLILKKVKAGVSADGILADVKASPLGDAQKNAVIEALSAGNPSASPAPSPSPSGGGLSGLFSGVAKGADGASHVTQGSLDQAVWGLADAIATGGAASSAARSAALAVRALAQRIAGAGGKQEVQTLIARAVQQAAPRLANAAPRRALTGGREAQMYKGGPFPGQPPEGTTAIPADVFKGRSTIAAPGGFDEIPPPKLALPHGGPIAQPGVRAGEPGSGVSALEWLQMMKRVLGV